MPEKRKQEEPQPTGPVPTDDPPPNGGDDQNPEVPPNNP